MGDGGFKYGDDLNININIMPEDEKGPEGFVTLLGGCLIVSRERLNSDIILGIVAPVLFSRTRAVVSDLPARNHVA